MLWLSSFCCLLHVHVYNCRDDLVRYCCQAQRRLSFAMKLVAGLGLGLGQKVVGSSFTKQVCGNKGTAAWEMHHATVAEHVLLHDGHVPTAGYSQLI